MNRQSSDYWKKLLVLAVVAVTATISYFQFRNTLTLQNLTTEEAELRSFQQDHAIRVYGAAFLLYVAVTGLSIPGATVLTLVYGWYFGFWRSVVLISFASTAGATVALLVSRFLLRDWFQSRFGETLNNCNRALKGDGAAYLLTLRLIPVVPFFAINAVMGLTSIRVRTFWWVSQAGMLPATAVYVYAGSSVPSLATLAEKGARGILTPKLFIALSLLGLVPLILKKTLQRFHPVESDPVMESHTAESVCQTPIPEVALMDSLDERS